MPPPIGFATFPGFVTGSIIRASYSCTHGPSPGVISVECQPMPALPSTLIGPFTFIFGNSSVTLRDCRIDTQSIRRNSQGLIWSFSLFDRRWKWRFGTTDGRYNYRLSDGTIDQNGRKTSQQLAAILFDEIGEPGDVSRMPSDSYPPVAWYAVNPALELARLGDMFGQRIVFDPISDSVAMWPAGVGNDLPIDDSVLEDSIVIDPPEAPDAIQVVCGPSKYDSTFSLEAVGIETNGQIKPIDNLSYKPSGGWTISDVGGFQAVTQGFKRDLAKATVFRWYRIAEAGLSVAVPGYSGLISGREQILPIDDRRIEEIVEDGAERRAPAEVRGTFYEGKLNYANSDPDTEYKQSFSIDAERGIVQFDEYVYKFNSSNKIIACDDLVLKTACAVSDPDNHQKQYVIIERQNPSGQTGAGTQVLLHTEIFGKYVDGVLVNESELTAEGNAYIDDAARLHETKIPRTISYGGLKGIHPDGAVQQVEWVVGGPFCTTRASRNNEHGATEGTTLAYAERRRTEELRKERLEDVARVVNEGRAMK